VAEVFLRKASGLVRDVSARDVLFFNTGGINIGIGVSYVFLIAYAFYPGANHMLALALVAALAAIQTVTYLFFTIIMPRSGGEYMFISRTLHPSIGFAISFSYTMMMAFYSAFAAGTFGQMGLSSLFHILTVKTGNAAWLNYAQWCESPWGSFLLGALLLIAFGFILIREMRVYLRVQAVTWVIAILGFVTMIIVLLSSSREAFMAAFNSYAGGFINDPDPYNAVIEAAKNNGFSFGSGFNFKQTVWSSVWPFFALAFGAQSASFAGEIRKVGRSQFIGTTGAVIFSTIVAMIFIAAAQGVMGGEFLGAIAYNSYEAPEFSTPATPWVHFLVSLATDNVLVLALIILGWLFWCYYWIPVNMLYMTRVAFAWSFDRLAPAALGEVHRKYHTPVNTIIAATVLSLLFLALIVLTPLLQTLSGIVTMTLAFVVVGLSAVVFPFVRRDLFERSPVNYRIAGIPVMSILGLLTAAGMGYINYRLLADPVVGANTTPSLIFVFGQIVLGFALFFIARAYRKSQGIDIDLAFREIPSE